MGLPKERYDALYGDAGHTAYYTKYRDRRQMVCAGADDGMLHAFNAGFYDRPAGSLDGGGGVYRGRFTRNKDGRTSGLPLGHEKWAFIPYQLLPQLKWLADPLYTPVLHGSEAEGDRCTNHSAGCGPSQRMGHGADRRDALWRQV